MPISRGLAGLQRPTGRTNAAFAASQSTANTLMDAVTDQAGQSSGIQATQECGRKVFVLLGVEHQASTSYAHIFNEAETVLESGPQKLIY